MKKLIYFFFVWLKLKLKIFFNFLMSFEYFKYFK